MLPEGSRVGEGGGDAEFAAGAPDPSGIAEAPCRGATSGATSGRCAVTGGGGAAGAVTAGAVTAPSGPGSEPSPGGSGRALIRKIIATMIAASAANPTAKNASTTGLIPDDRRGSGGIADGRSAVDANAADAFALNGAT
jgi:hypothetical protein